MPIPVVCSNCQTRLNAPDAAAGRRVKCPKCQSVIAVPAAEAPPEPPAAGGTPFDFGGSPPPPPPRRSGAEGRPAPRPTPPDEEPAAPPPAAGGGSPFDFGAAVSSADPGAADPGERPRRRRGGDEDAPPPEDRPRRRRPRDEDDAAPPADAGDDDRPRGRGRPPAKKKGGFPIGLVLGLLGVVLLFCCVGPIGGWFLFVGPKIKEWGEKARAENDKLEKQIKDEMKRRESGDGTTGGASVPAGWKEFRAKDGSFKAYFPTTPKEETQPQKGPKNSTPTIKQYTSESGDVMAGLIVIKFPAAMPAPAKTSTMDLMASMFSMKSDEKADQKDMTWLGEKGKETVLKEPGGTGEMVLRQVLVGNTAYVGMIGFKAARRQDQVDGFFNNIEALSK